MIDLAEFAGTDLAIEAAGIAAGEPTETVPLAGMQYHGYGRDDGLGGTVRPRRGDRLQLVREPDNKADENAIAVFWRNEHRIGHVPRATAADISAALDAGESVRAYLVKESDGYAWSGSVLLVGKPVALVHAADAAWEAARQTACVDDDGEIPF